MKTEPSGQRGSSDSPSPSSCGCRTRLEQNQSNKQPSLEVRETEEFSLLAEEPLTVDGFLGRENRLSLRVGCLVGQPGSSVPHS